MTNETGRMSANVECSGEAQYCAAMERREASLKGMLTSILRCSTSGFVRWPLGCRAD